MITNKIVKTWSLAFRKKKALLSRVRVYFDSYRFYLKRKSLLAKESIDINVDEVAGIEAVRNAGKPASNICKALKRMRTTMAKRCKLQWL